MTEVKAGCVHLFRVAGVISYGRRRSGMGFLWKAI